MNRETKPDPYCGFTDDRERRVELNARVRWNALAAMVAAFAGTSIDWSEKIRWLMSLFH